MDRRRVLVVDDSEVVTALIEAVVDNAGYEPVVVADGVTALAWLTAHHRSCALLLLDVRLPDIDGLDLLRQLQAVDPGVNTVVLTGDPEDERLDDVAAAGVAEVVAKPFRIDRLATVISRYADG